MRALLRRNAGFTILELMVAVAIVAILAAIALPQYKDYITRANLVDGTQQLAAYRAQMEQYYQDARTYKTKGAFTSPCDSPTTQYPNWTFTCVPADAAYTWTATGVAGKAAAGFTYTINQNNNQTSVVSASWGGGSYACWVMKKGGTC